MTDKEKMLEWCKVLSYGKRTAVVKRFFDELEKLGINYDIGIYANEHIHDFEFRFDDVEKKVSDIKLLNKIYRLTEKYEKIINDTCTNCEVKMEFGDYLCKKCYFEHRKSFSFLEISQLGFSSYEKLNYENEYIRTFFKWDEFSEATFEEELYSSSVDDYTELVKLRFKKVKINKNEMDYPYKQNYINVHVWHEGFFELLKNVPDFLFINIQNSNSDRLKRDNFFNSLNNCRICGYKAINQDGKCLVCKMYGYEKVLHERDKKKYANIEEWYKDGQLEYYLDYKNNKYKYPRRENEFEKLPNHKLLFTKEELKEFTKKNLSVRKKYDF